MKRGFLMLFLWSVIQVISQAQIFSGKVVNSDGEALENVKVFMVEDNISDLTDSNGEWTITASDQHNKTLVYHASGYVYDQSVKQPPAENLLFTLREALLSEATLRELDYVENSCSNISIPDDPAWNVSFEETTLKGDLAPNSDFTRRDPSAVINVNGLYYVWYSYSLTHDATKLAPWDRNDIYYSTSTDGITWDEQGIAVGRGEEGAFDARSVFTTEIFVHDGKYYLVYQAAADQTGIYDRNVVGMSVADSPDGPWTKLEEPVLYPSYTNDLFFDNNAVHDPCIIKYNDKFHLYYKGECNCRDNDACTRWCNPVCGLNKQVKWGVAVADTPEGPYVKSEFNPLTNTGHEVMVWPYANGVAILQHQDGPEANTIQFAEDGFNFSIKGKVSGIPEAAGLYRQEKSDSNPHAGISWGLAHVLKWDAGPKGWMYIRRFDMVNEDLQGLNIVADTFQVQQGDARQIQLKLSPYNASATLEWESEDVTIARVDAAGIVSGESVGSVKLFVRSSDGQWSDSCLVRVCDEEFDASKISVPANSFKTTGGTFNDGTVPLGFNKTSIGVNFVNSGDWGIYEVEVPEKGNYVVEYNVSTPSDKARVSLAYNGTVFSNDLVPNNGKWDSYYHLYASNVMRFEEKGTFDLKLIASGENNWQWNMRSFDLYRVSDAYTATLSGTANEIRNASVNYDSKTQTLFVSGVEGEFRLHIYSYDGRLCHSSYNFGQTRVFLPDCNSGLYLVRIDAGNLCYISKFFA